MQTSTQNIVDATPVKSFFVEMLTRDIDLVDAILDLLDNCVDGILREKGNTSDIMPYDGYKAEIMFNKNSFSISDNCGGIPQTLQKYAFRMGNARKEEDDNLPTVGVYGIGMKRAIFKIGQHCSILTQNNTDCYEVRITQEWIKDPNNWKLPVSDSSRPEGDGTTIVISKLNKGIATRFGEGGKEDFTREFTEKVQTHYAYIIDKGFEVEINGKLVEGKSTKLVFNEKIKPYVYQTHVDGVIVFLSVGLKQRISYQEDANDDEREDGYSSEDAGWTIICNDRAVLSNDRTELTGWGESGVPRYHTQFIAIAGIVEFHSNDPAKLPTTTTKRGVDASSPLFLQVKNKMREGMKLFTDYTNHWKDDLEESKRQVSLGKPKALDEIKESVRTLKMNPVKSGIKGEQLKRKLPRPEPKEPTKKRIVYNKESDEIQKVQRYLFGDQQVNPSKIGEECFDIILEEAK